MLSLQKPILLCMSLHFRDPNTLLTGSSKSQVCQTKDWRAHKYNCSVLPPGGLLPAEIEDQVELHAEVARLTKLLIGWNNAHADDESASTDKFSSSKIPEARLIAGDYQSYLSSKSS